MGRVVMADENDFTMIPVVSGQIASVGYNPETKVMRIRFSKSGALYEYQQVPEDVYQALMAAPSKGSFFAGIKFSFAYERLE
jgi:hypothetical protein